MIENSENCKIKDEILHLKPCPFCGSIAEIDICDDNYTDMVVCTGCNASMPPLNPSDKFPKECQDCKCDGGYCRTAPVAKMWNTRYVPKCIDVYDLYENTVGDIKK